MEAHLDNQKDLAALDVIDSAKHSPDAEAMQVDPIIEKAALRKFDKFLLPVAFLFLLLSSLDRSNIGNARVFGFDEDIGLHGRQFSDINTLFFVTFILFETPWVMAVKRFGPNRALGTALIEWSACTLATGFIHNYGGAIACRMLLGACEAGVSPSFAYIFSTIYGRSSTAKRIAMGNICNTVAGAFGGLFAYGIQMMARQRGIAAWRWLFIIEGSVTLVAGGVGWLFLPLPSRGSPSSCQPSSRVSGAALRYESLKVNYMTIPVNVAGAISLLAQAYYSDKVHRRAPFLVGSAVPVAAGYLICVGTSNAAAGYFGMFLLASGCYTISTIVVTWVATNLMPDYKRSVALPVFYSIGNMSGLVSSQLYPTYHAPRYVMGNALSAGLEVVFVGFVVAAWLLLRRRNAEKDRLAAEGATTNGLEGDMALGFKYCL